MKTDKNILSKGLKLMGVTLLLMFLGPTFIFIAFTNKEKPLYIPLLIAGVLLCFGAVYYGFKGLKTIMNSMFKK